MWPVAAAHLSGTFTAWPLRTSTRPSPSDRPAWSPRLPVEESRRGMPRIGPCHVGRVGTAARPGCTVITEEDPVSAPTQRGDLLGLLATDVEAALRLQHEGRVGRLEVLESLRRHAAGRAEHACKGHTEEQWPIGTTSGSLGFHAGSSLFSVPADATAQRDTSQSGRLPRLTASRASSRRRPSPPPPPSPRSASPRRRPGA